MKKTFRQSLRAHLEKIDFQPKYGKKVYKLKSISDNFITMYVYRDEFGEGEEGRKMMDAYIDNVGRFVEQKHPTKSLIADIIFRKKGNMKNVEKYP